MGTKKVLIAEDSSVIQNLTKKILQIQNYDIFSAKNGVQVLDMISKDQFDIILMDIQMPEMDGPTLLGELRKTRPELKVIFVSGYAEDAFKKNLEDETLKRIDFQSETEKREKRVNGLKCHISSLRSFIKSRAREHKAEIEKRDKKIKYQQKEINSRNVILSKKINYSFKKNYICD